MGRVMMMNGWAYRFCSQTNEDGIVEWSVRTVYYGADGNIVSNGSMPGAIWGNQNGTPARYSIDAGSINV